MEYLFYLTTALEWILLIYFGFAAFYVFLFALASLFRYRPKRAAQSTLRKIAVLIPGYKEDAVIVDVAKDALQQDYSAEHYDVVVIADSFQPETLAALREHVKYVIDLFFLNSNARVTYLKNEVVQIRVGSFRSRHNFNFAFVGKL